MQYSKFLTPAEFHARFSPNAGDVRKMQSALRELGFKVAYTPDRGLFVAASAILLSPPYPHITQL